MARKPFDPNAMNCPPPDTGGSSLFGGGSGSDADGTRSDSGGRQKPGGDGNPSGKRGGKRDSKREEAMTVSQMSDVIKTTLANALPRRVRVIGEVSNFSDRRHWYFSLKDEGASLNCVCFASSAAKVRFPVRDGAEVVCSGRIDYFPARGQLQLYVDSMQPIGEGALEAQFRALCDELRERGYFDVDTKLRIPAMATRVAVVTSRAAAALQDVINTARKRWPGCQLDVMDVRVQGPDAAPQIARAIRQISEHGPGLGIDAIIVTRGGGSMEDLWAFNEREVADAIHACKLPIVAAIGHETDTTIAELVADVRCSTPTQAAMLVVPDRAALQHQVDQIARRLTLMLSRQQQIAQHRLNGAAQHPFFRKPDSLIGPALERVAAASRRLTQALRVRSDTESRRLAMAARHPFFRRPEAMIDPVVQCVDRLSRALDMAMRRRIETDAEQLRNVDRELEAVGPQNVLARGFSYTLDADGQVVRQPQQTPPGSKIRTVLASGELQSVVTDPDGSPPVLPPAAARPKAPAPARRRRKRKTDDDHPTLF